MRDLPRLTNPLASLVVRTDFSDEAAWARLCAAIAAPDPDEGFRADVQVVDDPAFEGLGRDVDDLTALGRRDPTLGVLFVVDRRALTDPAHPILALDLDDEPARTVRVLPREMWGIQNNLAIANMAFAEFADAADADGVFRGFPPA